MHKFCGTERVYVAARQSMAYACGMAVSTEIEGLLNDMAGAAGRPGPRPLPAQVGWALSEYAKKGTPPADIMTEMAAMAEGVRKYMAHPFRREVPLLEVIWKENQTKLYFCKRKGKKKRGSIAIIPSMINRSYILDLLPDRSFVRWLAAQGFDVFLLDWGDPARDAGSKSMENIITKRLLPAIRFAAQKSDAPVHAVGYCMGGTLLAAAAALEPEFLQSAVFLASPWDFHAGDRVLTDHVRTGTPAALQMIGAGGALPVDWIQSVFAAVNGNRTVRKFAKFAAMDQDGDAARLFVAVEDWLNDGVDLPGEMGRSCLADWFDDNKTGGGTWEIGADTVDLSAIDVPSLVVASARDRLVPAESSLAMAERLPRADVLNPDIGHIGMMSGGNAEKDVWQPVADWLYKL